MLKLFLTIILSTLFLFSEAQEERFNHLKVGDEAPVFFGKDYKGESVDLAPLLKKGKVVIVFYRGAWCPYCNRHMSNLQDSLSFITKTGASLLAISPETNLSIEQTIEKTKAQFLIIHDSLNIISKKYGVAFKVSDATVLKYKLFGINLDVSNGNTDNILPVPATFIINQSGMIEFINFDENYKYRLPVLEIIKQLIK